MNTFFREKPEACLGKDQPHYKTKRLVFKDKRLKEYNHNITIFLGEGSDTLVLFYQILFVIFFFFLKKIKRPEAFLSCVLLAVNFDPVWLWGVLVYSRPFEEIVSLRGATLNVSPES